MTLRSSWSHLQTIDDIEKAKAEGVSDFLLKPVDEKMLSEIFSTLRDLS